MEGKFCMKGWSSVCRSRPKWASAPSKISVKKTSAVNEHTEIIISSESECYSDQEGYQNAVDDQVCVYNEFLDLKERLSKTSR